MTQFATTGRPFARPIAAVFSILGCLLAVDAASAKEPNSASDRRGIVASAPAGVRAVKVDGGYMVPYSEKIPGTDVSFEMIPVPSGEFVMGSPEAEAERGDDEGPQVRIQVEPFWIGKCEVTWAEYHAFMDMYEAFKTMQRITANPESHAALGPGDKENLRLVQAHARNGKIESEWGVDAVTSPTPLYDPSFTYSVGDQPNQPAVTMTSFGARQYTKWLSRILGTQYRLPTEAEWEYAARAGTKSAWSFGDDADQLDDHAWTEDNGEGLTHAVGTKKPNPWGLYDMHGNVAEWTLDQYYPDAYAKLRSDAVDAATAVQWPTKLYPRSIRGGSWLEPPAMSRSAARHKSDKDREWKLSDPNLPLSPWWFTEEPATAVGMRIVRPLNAMSDEVKTKAWEADIDDVRQDVKEKLIEGRGAIGVADESLPAAAKAAETLNQKLNEKLPKESKKE
jgi:formylglycine-generating enzyme required for sulfatase activity